MICYALLLASALVFLAVAIYAKVRSGVGAFIVLSGLIIAIFNLLYILLKLV